MRPAPWWIAALARLYPPDHRAHYGHDLAAEIALCVARERTLHGRIGAVLHIIWDARRSAHSSPRTSGDSLMQSLLDDVRHACGCMLRRPVFSIPVIPTRARAIGATSAIFSVVNTVLLSSLR